MLIQNQSLWTNQSSFSDARTTRTLAGLFARWKATKRDASIESRHRRLRRTNGQQLACQTPLSAVQNSGTIHGHLFAEVAVHSRNSLPFEDREQSAPDSNADLQAQIEAITAESGQPLPHRAELEELLGQSLAGVEVYTSQEARQLLQQLEARAAVYGDKLLLAEADPSMEVLLHEAVHLLQGKHGAEVSTPDLGLDVIPADSPIEAEAQRIEHDAGAATFGSEPMFGARRNCNMLNTLSTGTGTTRAETEAPWMSPNVSPSGISCRKRPSPHRPAVRTGTGSGQ
jgi:hypothetical protein